jgi:hypothetical protein
MEKWLMIMMAVVFGSLAIGDGIEKHQLAQCKIAAIQAGMSADDVAKACGKR